MLHRKNFFAFSTVENPTLNAAQKEALRGLLDDPSPLVRRDEASRTHVYQAAQSEDETQRQLVGDLLHRAFDGAAGKLVLRALEDGKVTAAELDEIRRLLNKRSGERQ